MAIMLILNSGGNLMKFKSIFIFILITLFMTSNPVLAFEYKETEIEESKQLNELALNEAEPNELLQSIALEKYDNIVAELKNPSKYIKEDKKIECTATTKNNFAVDRVLVALTKEASLSMVEYTEKDFSEIGAVSVELLTEYDTNNLSLDYKEKVEEYTNYKLGELKSVKSSAKLELSKVDNAKSQLYARKAVLEKYNNFHKIYAINLHTTTKDDILKIINVLEKRDDIYIAEPDFYSELCSAPNDTYYSKQWAFNDINISSAWDEAKNGKKVLVGVIDTGIDKEHPDLKANVNTSIFKSFVDSKPFTDTANHGTAVAGVIGAVTNNSKGVAGTCHNVSLVSFKDSKDLKSEVSSYYYTNAVNEAKKNGISILNLSSSVQGDLFSTALNNYDGLFVSSAGNEGLNIDNANKNSEKIYPSILTNDNLISVAAVDKESKLAKFSSDKSSNYGKKSVDLAAPGVDIYTTLTDKGNHTYYEKDKNNNNVGVSGTSFAAPYVSGVAALIKSKYPTISYKGIKSAILDNVTSVSALSGKVKTGGKLNAGKALSGVEKHKFTVKYNKNGGTGTMSNTSVIYGIPTALRKNTFTKTGSHFKGWTAHRNSDNKWLYNVGSSTGWYVEGSQPSGASKHIYKDGVDVLHTSSEKGDTVTFYAQWETNIYIIKYKSNIDDNQAMGEQIITYGTGQKLRKNTFYKNGYIFKGWYGYRTSDKKWLYSDGESEKWYVENGQPSGYNKKLYKDEATVSKTSAVHNDTVYMYAQWEPYQFLISFDGNGGIGSKDDMMVYNDRIFELGANTFMKQGYTFVGWTVYESDGYWFMNNNTWSEDYSESYPPKRYSKNESASFLVEEGLTLTAYAQWADNNTMKGDVDFDGNISVKDTTLIQQYISKIIYLNNNQFYAADFNQDGIVNILDVTAIQKYLVNN